LPRTGPPSAARYAFSLYRIDSLAQDPVPEPGRWAEESGRDLTAISRTLAMSVDQWGR